LQNKPHTQVRSYYGHTLIAILVKNEWKGEFNNILGFDRFTRFNYWL
jgi:hypothetical protein